MSDGHPVLGERASLVRADGGRRAEGLDGLQVLDQAVLAGHALGRQSETHGDGSEQTFGYVGHDDTDEEDDGIEPLVAERKSDDEESHSQEHGHSGDQVDEVGNLAGDRSLARIQTGGQTGDAAHHRVVADADDDGAASTWHEIKNQNK